MSVNRLTNETRRMVLVRKPGFFIGSSGLLPRQHFGQGRVLADLVDGDPGVDAHADPVLAPDALESVSEALVGREPSRAQDLVGDDRLLQDGDGRRGLLALGRAVIVRLARVVEALKIEVGRNAPPLELGMDFRPVGRGPSRKPGRADMLDPRAKNAEVPLTELLLDAEALDEDGGGPRLDGAVDLQEHL